MPQDFPNRVTFRAGGHWQDGEDVLHVWHQRNQHAALAARKPVRNRRQIDFAIGVVVQPALRSKTGRFQTEILAGPATDQPSGPIGGSIDGRTRMYRPSLSLDTAQRAEIDNHCAEKLPRRTK